MLASAAGERYDSDVISSTRARSEAGRMSLRLLAAAAWIVLALLPLRAEPVDVAFEGARIDLLPLAEVVQGLSREATIELPAAGGTSRQPIALSARGPGPLFRWAVFTLHNPAPHSRELVVAAPHQRFVASQVLWPRPDGSRVVGLATSDGRPIAPLASLGADSFAVTVPPGATISYVLEVSATGLDSLSLWHRGAFHIVTDRYAFFRGLVLGISFLLVISFICVFIVKPRAVFPATALFGCSAIAFLLIEAGYLPTVLAKFPALLGSEQKLRAVTEGLMLAGVIAMLASFLELRRWMPLAGTALMASGAAAAALAVYGWFEPRLAIGLIRIAFAAVVAIGLGLMVVLWRRGAARAQASLFGWIVLAGWTVAAALGALGLVEPALMHPLISAGLVLVLVTTGFTLAQLAFGLGTGWNAAFEEAGRRALALAASDQAVWDWQADQGRLHIGAEIERALGLEEGACREDAAAWLDLIHPADRLAYGAAVESAERRGRGSFSQEFRLRRADGSYRWYLLRGRAMPSGNERASRLIGTLADVTTLRRSEDRLLADAVRDRLTGLPNRALFLDRLEQAMGHAPARADAGLYVIVLDLDRFKSFNDGLGVEAGDYLLNTTGRRLLACIGPADTLARLRGHQFGIIWNAGHNGSDITELTIALGAAVAQPIHLPAGEVVITASMGVVRVHQDYRKPDAVLKDAEIALYEAKRQGYGSVEFFRPDMHDERSALLQLEQNLRHALERNEIEVVYQPIVRLADRELAGFEALMRWRRGELVLEPDSFMGLAEETGIIRELGSYVLKEAAGRLGTWQRAFRPQEPLFVAVNISSVQLLNGDLVEDIQRLIEREDLRPGTLKLELTESLVVENPELAHKLLIRLKQMGVALACDDFGTGYSGLESVFRLPFDSVKIDRVFLEGESGDRNWIMVEAMLRLARELKLDVVAEGIETDEQMERLSRLGCDYGQGYLIGPPVTAQQVVEGLGGLSYGAKGRGRAWRRSGPA
jgi:diguanylate cyclase (GGDEF)-like protein/PAS domain S-box-containing protein